MPRYELQATRISLFLVFLHTPAITPISFKYLINLLPFATICIAAGIRIVGFQRPYLPSSTAALPLHLFSLSFPSFNQQVLGRFFFWKRPRHFTQSSTCMNMVEQQQYITAGLPHTGDLAGSHSLSDDRSIVSVGTPTYSEVTPFSAVCISRLTPQNPALYFAALQLFSPLSCPVFCNGCKLTNRFFSP